jgi:hypothetical protein
MSIRFNDCFFTEPVDLNTWMPPKCPGLFSVLVTDPNWAPKAFEAVYFGEIGNNSPESALLQECSHVKAAAGGKHLLVSVFPMPFSTTQQRFALLHELVRAYNPVYQAGAAEPAQTTHLKIPDALPIRRRQFGFVPDTAL